MIFIDWGDLERSWRLNDGDIVSASFEDIAANTAEFVLELAPHKTWWKGVQLLDNTDGQIGFLEVENGTNMAGPLGVSIRDINVGGHIVLWKAKAFGIHTPMYLLTDLEHVNGKRVTFRWSAD